MKVNHVALWLVMATVFSWKSMTPSLETKEFSRGPASEKEEKKPEVECKKESNGDKLEKDLKKLIEDKVAIISEIDELKKENKSLKSKIDKKDKKENTKEEKEEVVVTSGNNDMAAMMAQITSLFSAQMQQQMQMQMQFMTMMFNQSAYQQPLDYSYLMPNFTDSLSLYGSRIGSSINGPQYFANPYAMFPESRPQIIERQPAQADWGIPRTFDFNLKSDFERQEIQSQQFKPQQPQFSTRGLINT